MKRRSRPKFRSPRPGPSRYAAKQAQRSALGRAFTAAKEAFPDWRPKKRCER